MADLIDKDEFRSLVFEVVNLIPKGRATSYGAIAKAIGFPQHSRLVGKVMGCSRLEDVPAYRVVNSEGKLSGKDAFGLPDAMQRLLEEEGVKVKNNKIVNWKNVFWDPVSEMNIDE